VVSEGEELWMGGYARDANELEHNFFLVNLIPFDPILYAEISS